MTEAGWTREKPTVVGWYWIRAPKHGWRDCVMWVDQDDDGFYIDVGDCDTEYVTDIDAEWLGPITPDSYQQGRVAGLRECKHGLDIALDEGPLKAALYRWIDARAERLEREAQQAQEEHENNSNEGHS